MEDKFKWTGAKTKLINKIGRSRSKSTYYRYDLPLYVDEMITDDYIQSTKFGFGNYELTKKGREKFKEQNPSNNVDKLFI